MGFYSEKQLHRRKSSYVSTLIPLLAKHSTVYNEPYIYMNINYAFALGEVCAESPSSH